MAERARITFDETDTAARDVHDLLLVVGLVLNADPGDLSARLRGALATMIRLGEDRAKVVHMGLDDLQEERR